MPKFQIFNGANMSFKAFRENEILAKMSEFTVNCFLKSHEITNNVAVCQKKTKFSLGISSL